MAPAGDGDGRGLRRFGPFLVALGAAAYLVSGFLRWGGATLEGALQAQVRVKGARLSFMVGAVLMIAAVGMAVSIPRAARTALAALGVVGGVAGAGFALYFLVSKDPFVRSAASVIAEHVGRSTEVVERTLRDLIERGGVQVSVSRAVGAFVALGGGTLALTGAVVSISEGPEGEPDAPPPLSAETPGGPREDG
jgi:hypothetical protein